jgi:hypothetical protein
VSRTRTCFRPPQLLPRFSKARNVVSWGIDAFWFWVFA